MGKLVHCINRTYSYRGHTSNRTSVSGMKHQTRTSQTQEMSERPINTRDCRFVMAEFRWRPSLSRGHDKVFSPPAGARKGEGQGGFLIILAFITTRSNMRATRGFTFTCDQLPTHEVFVRPVRERLTWRPDQRERAPRICYKAYGNSGIC